LGWYGTEGLTVRIVPLTWGDVITALSSGSIDVAIYNFNSFQAPYENASKGSRKPVFYCPLYLFKGQAIMVHGNSGFKPYEEDTSVPAPERARRIVVVAAQLRGRSIAVTEGTELEQIVLQAIEKANLKRSDVKLIHASPEDSLAAFLAGSVDAFAAGLTERVEARRHGAVELLTTSDVAMPVVDGLITTEEFASAHRELLDKLCVLWFRTIQYMNQDLVQNSSTILDYLKSTASTRYAPEEYKVAWTFNVFPPNARSAKELFSNSTSPYYWKVSWDANNSFLLREKKITVTVPYSAYLGDETLSRLAQGNE